MATYNGTSGNDTYGGTTSADTINGNDGDDVLSGNDGNDTIDGGLGNDTIHGDEGDDTIIIGRGDTVHGDNGDDILSYTSSDLGGATTNIAGDAGTDTLTFDFSGATDAITSGNYLDGSGYIDGIGYSGIEKLILIGGSASDQLAGGIGDDILTGGAGNDRLDGHAGNNTIDGGAGKDIGLIDLSADNTAHTVNFTANVTLNIGGSQLSHIEGLGLKTGSGVDVIDVSAESIGSEIFTNGGNDKVTGGIGADTIDTGAGNDTIYAGRGDTVLAQDDDDNIHFSDDSNTGAATNIAGGAGNDAAAFDFSSASDAISSGNYLDYSGYVGGVGYNGIETLIITGGTADDTLVGGLGDDTLKGNAGDDRLDGHTGLNTIDGGAGNDIGLIDLSASNTVRTVTFDPTVTLNLGGNHLSNIEGLGIKTGGGADVINVAAETIGSEIYTNAGNDTITGGAAADIIDAGVGNDTIYAGRGDTVHAQDGNDKIFFSSNANTGATTNIAGDLGTDTLTLDFSASSQAITSGNYLDTTGYAGGVGYGGIENVVLTGGTASDTLVGGIGDDTLNGGAGNDTLDGHAGLNTIDGGSGKDIGLIDLSASNTARIVTFVAGTMLSVGGNTLSNIEGLGLKTGGGVDKIDVSGETIGSVIYTNAGNDTITGGAAADFIDAGAGNDVVYFGRGDTVHGGIGADKFLTVLDENTGAATSIAGEGDNDTLTVDLSAATDAITSNNYGDLSGSVAGVGYNGIELLVLTGGSASDTLVGGIGNDTLTGGAGNDTLDGQQGHNTIDGGAGKDIGLLDLSNTSANLTVTFHNDVSNTISGSTLIHVEGLGFHGGTGIDKISVAEETIGSKLYGGDGNDTLTGGASADYLDGGNNDDMIKAGAGDTVLGQGGNDALIFTTSTGTGSASMAGGAGINTLTLDFTGYSGNITSVNYGDGSGSATSVSYSGIDALTFTGGSGSDLITGGAGGDTLNGADGNDVLLGGGGKDTLTGGIGGDHFKWSVIADSTVASTGRDTVTDFTAGDKFDMTALETSTGHAFTFIAAAAFSHTAGEIQYAASGADTLVNIDTNGDGAADFAFLVTGAHVFTSGDFLL